MILSSALRMIMYINNYNLTFRRIQVLWALAVIFFLMTGITIFIYFKEFPLFSYGIVVVTVFYIALSFSRPDYWIARYNLMNEEYTGSEKRYLSSLSSDAAPAILNPQINPDVTQIQEILSLYKTMDYSDIKHMPECDDSYWTINYCQHIQYLSDNMHLRNFNFSIYKAQNYLID